MRARADMKSIIGSNRKTAAQSLGEIIGELKKVTWPARHEVIRLTSIVLVICIASGIIIGLFDFGFSELVSNVFVRGA